MKSYRLEHLKISGLDFIFKKNYKINDKAVDNIYSEQLPIDNTIVANNNNSPANLEVLRLKYSSCKKCPLHQTKHSFVYGDGNQNAEIMIIGEGPGAKEDQQGHVFVGPAGELLTKMLKAIEIDRTDVYITNIVKCRPPQNRDPFPIEKQACLPYLKEQISIIKPKVILLFGKVAATTLINDPNGNTLSFYRGKEWSYQGIRTFVTYHPSALLHNSSYKLPTWHDLQHIKHYLDNFNIQ